jgi:phosphate transport system ATP-binding protein
MKIVPLTISKGIEIRNFEIYIDARKRVAIDHLAIPERGVIAVLGASGCGKSTFLRVLANIHGPTITYNGQIVEHGHLRGDTAHLKYAMVWQVPTVFPCGIYDNLKIPLRKRKVPRHEWQAAMKEVLERTGLAPELGSAWRWTNSTKLSGGQRQRLCIAVGLLMDSDVLLLDEPTSALDPIATEKVEQIILDLGRERSVVLVTHSIGQARRISNVAAVFCMKDGYGYLCENGPTARVLYEPVAEASRRFLRMEIG